MINSWPLKCIPFSIHHFSTKPFLFTFGSNQCCCDWIICLNIKKHDTYPKTSLFLVHPQIISYFSIPSHYTNPGRIILHSGCTLRNELLPLTENMTASFIFIYLNLYWQNWQVSYFNFQLFKLVLVNLASILIQFSFI